MRTDLLNMFNISAAAATQNRKLRKSLLKLGELFSQLDRISFVQLSGVVQLLVRLARGIGPNALNSTDGAAALGHCEQHRAQSCQGVPAFAAVLPPSADLRGSDAL